MSKQVAQARAREHYPAPYAIVDLWRGTAAAATAYGEAESIGALLVTQTSRNLVRVFVLQERLKGLATNVPARRVHVVGAGVMGGDIAAWCAIRGHTVTLQDRAQQFVDPALERARELFGNVRRPATPRPRCALDGGFAPSRSAPPTSSSRRSSKTRMPSARCSRRRAEATGGRARRDQHIEHRARGAVAAFARPGRLVGLHFFNPVARCRWSK